MMKMVNLFHAKTHLSKLVDQIASGEENEFVISRNGKPVARMVPIIQNKDVSCRIGIAVGEFTLPDNIDSANDEILGYFTRIRKAGLDPPYRAITTTENYALNKMMLLIKLKNCPGCSQAKPLEEFVTIYGFKNAKGKFCRSCFIEHQRKHAMSLLEGRDFCLYCGIKIEKAYDWTPDGKSAKTYIHLDHMDPVSLGGENTENNTVCCCVMCNLKKNNKLFIDWLAELKPEYRELSRKIYIEKHNIEPEKFITYETRRNRFVPCDLG